MKVAYLNYAQYGSTGNIMMGIGNLLKEDGGTPIYCVAKCMKNLQNKTDETLYVGSIISRKINAKLAYISGKSCCFSKYDTKVLVRKLKREKPDLIHINNLHGEYINVPILFQYIKEKSIPVVWTLHDCWPFTGHCPYFDIVHCNKWKTSCFDCPMYTDYPESKIDNSSFMWKYKKEWFLGVENMTIVTPSVWLSNLVKESFLANYPVKVINNGIDLSIFKPTESLFREKYNIDPNKIILLGVSFVWGERKGLDVFNELASLLNREKYQIVLVGTDEEIEKTLDPSIISIRKTSNQSELAEIYSASDIFVNPTREDNFPTVNLEAIACGTPCVSFNTGGSPECFDASCGLVVNCDDIPSLINAISKMSNKELQLKEKCISYSKHFDKNSLFKNYVDLYSDIINE